MSESMNRLATTLPSGTLTFLFSDIESSTALLRGLGRERYGELLALHNELLRRAFDEAGGVEIDRQGDAFFAVFASAEAAVAAAASIQRALAARSWPDGARVRVRLGLHTGEATVSADGYVGVAVHQAARIGDLGHGGQVLLSRTTAALVERELPPGLRLEELGPVSLEGLDRDEHVFQLVIEGLPDEFPRLRARGRPPAPAGPPAGGTLLERDGELAAIRAHLDAAAAGGGRLVAIEARAGMGKTRLVAETRRLAAAAGLAELSARGGELEHEFAFGIVRQLFETVLAAAPPDERRELLDGPAAGAAALFEAATFEQGADDATGVSFATLHALYWLAANVALRRPTVLVVDDLHWADAPSLRWLAHLQRRLDGLPLLVVVATRPPEQSREATLVTEILAEPTALVRPAALSADAVAVLARDAFAAEPEPGFVAACHDATGGNPLFVRALLDTLVGQGVRPVDTEASRVLEVGPEPVSRAVMLRLARLPSEATDLVRAVAVLGNGSALHDAGALAGLEREQAAHAATTLARADLLRLELPLEFTHPVVRTAVYEAMSPGERIAAHRRAAERLAEARAEPELIAVHLEHVLPAGDPFVVATLRHAAERALRRGASDVAISFLRRALEEPPAGDERGEILLALGLAERLVDTDAAIVHLRETIDAIGDDHRAARIALELGRALQRGNRHADAIDVLRRGRELAGDDLDMEQSLTAELIGASCWEPEHLLLAEQELARIRPDQLVDGYGGDLLRAVLAYFEARRGHDRERALALADAAVAAARIPVTGSRALYLAGYALTVAGRPDTAIAAYEAGFREGLRRGDNVLAGGCLLFESLAHLHVGRLAEAEEALARVSEHAEFTMMRPYRSAFEAWIALERGDLTGAERALAAAGLPDRLPANAHLTFFHLVRGRTRFHRLGPEAGIADLLALGENAETLRLRNPAFVPWRPYAALALHAAGRQEEALALAREAVELARGWGADRMLGVTLRTLGLVEGGEEGLARLEEALAVLAASHARLEHAKALVELGAALRRGNRRADAREHLREGLDLAHRLGAGALRERAKIELAATGARPRRLTLRGVDALTPSERRVVELAAQELTNKAIAQELFVTPKTVEVHLSSAYRKLGIGSRTQLAEAIAGS